MILGAITPAKSPGRKSTFVAAVRGSLPDVRDSLDPEDAERNEIMIGRIEELARQTESPLERLERMVHPWTSYLVLPHFALVNAGVALSAEFIRQAFTSAVTLGVMLRLVLGKVVGVTGYAWLAVRLGWATLPGGVAWRHITGAALIGGVGFTVSLFIINDLKLVKPNDDLALHGVNFHHLADVAVEDLLLVVVLGLNHLVAHPKLPAKIFDDWFIAFEGFIQPAISSSVHECPEIHGSSGRALECPGWRRL